MIVAGVPYACAALTSMSEISGGTPYGATTIVGADGKRHPTQNELDIARYQGKHVAELAVKIAGK
jgi:NAD(P)H dehydrogenase (quinone)